MNFLANEQVARVLPAAIAAQTTLTSLVRDMKGFDSITFIVFLGDVTVDCVLTLQAKHGDLADGSDAVDIAGALATFTAGATDADDNMLSVEVARPTKRFLRASIARGAANAIVDGMISVQTSPAEAPITDDPTLLAKKFSLSPV